MDYTLAIYNQPEMDRLSIEATTHKLVDRGYPRELLDFAYRLDFPIRGLFIDRKLGNVLKMDRYRYVKRAYHGTTELTYDERREQYHMTPSKVASKRYHWVDTLYALSEVAMFSGAVEVLEGQGQTVNYDQLFNDIRACIDLSHQDGSILDRVLADIPRYVLRDPDLALTLHKLRSSGKRLFVLTNSRHGYTDKMMTYLLGNALPEYPTWKHYFDYIVTASAKPRFFTEAAAFQEILENGDAKPASVLERGRVYAGGNIAEFETAIGCSGDEVLYVGDHIYGDVLRAKKESAWRTTMIIQEMEDELLAFDRRVLDIDTLDQMDRTRGALQDELRDKQVKQRELQRKLDAQKEHGSVDPGLEAESLLARRAIDKVRVRLKQLDVGYNALEVDVDNEFHPYWGTLFKTGQEASNFGAQVEQYACLYTSRVSNFALYSPMHYFRSPRDRMPHEM